MFFGLQCGIHLLGWITKLILWGSVGIENCVTGGIEIEIFGVLNRQENLNKTLTNSK